MKIARVEIEGFGRLRDLRIDVAPGLHIFYGPNEAGKSTLQQAILALLYGFYEGNRARRDENDLRERYDPWAGDTYAGRLEYELSGGRRIRVVRDFDTADQPTEIWDLETGLDVTDQFGRGRHGNVPFALEHLGMTKRVFESCAFVSQGELFQIADEAKASPQEIGETIVRLADTAGRDVSAQSALVGLDKVLREQVGGPMARTTPLPVARRRLEDLRAELAAIDGVRAEVAADAKRLEASRVRADELRRETVRARYLLGQAEASEFRARVQHLGDLAARERELRAHLDEHASFASFPIEERDDVREARRSVRDLRDSIESERDEIEGQRRQLEELNAERQALTGRERQLAHLRDFPVHRQSEVDQLVRAWREAGALASHAQERLEAAAAEASPVLEEYEHLATRVGHLTSADVAQLMSQLQEPLPPRGAGAFAGAILRAIGRGLRWLWRQAVVLARWPRRTITRQPSGILPADREVASKATAVTPSPDEARELLTLNARYREIVPLVEKERVETTAAERASQHLAVAAQALRDALADLVDDTADPGSAYDAFVERSRERDELEGTIERLANNERGRTACTRAIDGFEAGGERLERQEERLRQRLMQATGLVGELDTRIEAFEEGCRRKRAYDEAKREVGEVETRRGIVLEGRSPRELEDAARRYEQESERLHAQHSWLSGAQTSEAKEAIQDRFAPLENELKQLEVEISRLEAKIETVQRDLRPRAEVEEEIARREAEAAALESFRDELGIAIELIDEAAKEAHRDFGPRVGRFLSEGLARVTGNRYGRAWLDPNTLQVTTEVPETRRPENVERLSRGTRAAAYLLLRIGLAQHMSSIGEPVPLILDDPLVDLDDVRVEHFLDLLLDLATDVQILLFAKDETIRAGFERHCEGGGHHGLTFLPGPTVTT